MSTRRTRSPSAEEYAASCAQLAWSYAADALDPDADATIFIMAVLRIGSWEQILDTFAYYGRAKVEEVFLADFHGHRTLPLPVRVFWANVFLPGVVDPEIADPKLRWRRTRQVPSGPD